MSEKIRILREGLNVSWIHWNLMANPHLWNRHTARTAPEESPHLGLDDVWVRFGPEEEARTGRPHFSVWYPEADVLGLKPFLRDLMHSVGKDVMGGVLITRIPAGASCKPHEDGGWHALHYEKFGVQIASAPGQKFCYDDVAIETKPGDLFWFNNQATHWVTNPTAYERITMIVCLK